MEQEKFKKSILPLRPGLIGYAVRLLSDKEEAADIVQEVFFKLWFMRDDLERYDNVQALAMQITKHLCLNRIKVIQREWDRGRLAGADEASIPDIQLEQRDMLDHVVRIIETLPDLLQSILRMKHIDGLEVEEIAVITGSSPEAIRMNLSRGRKRVKEIFLKWQR